MSDPSLFRFRTVVEGALEYLESRRREINDLNVFPVADGDTGDNMVLTLRACLDELDRLAGSAGERSLDEIGRDEIVQSVARAALLGARGNSGVILSQLIRGAAEELISRPGALVDPALIGSAMIRASNHAYSSVRNPAEGTMLTVMREMAASVVTEVAHLPDVGARLGDDVAPAFQDELIAEVLERAIAVGEASVRRGPDMLPALREAGVVDAGGYGVITIFAGMVAALRRGEGPELAHHAAPATAARAHSQHESSTYRYCTNFAVTGSGLDAARWVVPLEALGDSVLVVGDDATLKVHIHTDEPERATALFAGVGEVSRLDVADMREQEAERAGRLASDGARSLADGRAARERCATLAVASGPGMGALFASVGASVLDGGATLNPSTHEMLAAIHELAADEVVLLPNSANVIMAAERAAELSDKPVHVVATTSQQAGLAVAIAMSPSRGAEENAAAMERALARLRTGGVAPAARADAAGRFAVGDAVGFVDDELVAWGDPQGALREVLARIGAEAELITCIAGEDPPLGDDAVRALAPAGVDLECEAGDQPGWWWLLAAE